MSSDIAGVPCETKISFGWEGAVTPGLIYLGLSKSCSLNPSTDQNEGLWQGYLSKGTVVVPHEWVRFVASSSRGCFTRCNSHVGGYWTCRMVLKILFFSFRFAFSLENIYKELSTDIDGFVHPGHGDLTGWAKQGKPTTTSYVLGRFQQFSVHLLMFVKDINEEWESSNRIAKLT